MGLDFFTDLLILGFGAICIHYLVRKTAGIADFFLNILTIIPLSIITARSIETAVIMLTMIVVWEIRSLREDSEQK
ncbi:hypothetical protein [Staphylococcus halotolerans]|uniref:hypothetical protein n=1 Tax=Staphylococcus sp. 50Mo3-2 TaxID=3135642 RepID=UPI003D171B04